jgi:very-short-patch-repair endonuclease
LATAQGGPISRAQLLELGFGRGAIDHALRSGRLHRYFRGVYLLGHEAITSKGRVMAPVLACGPGARLSHRSAADWWDFLRTSRARVDVTVPGRTRTGHPGIDLHLVRGLDPRDVTEHEGVPITTVARTLLDLAEVVPPRLLERAVNEADRLRLFDGNAVRELLTRSPGRRGLKPLRALLADLTPEPVLRSELERTFWALCRDFSLPRPVMKSTIHGYEVDAYWPGTNLIVELDGYDFHRDSAAFEADRLRDAELLLAGYRVVRVTWRQLTKEPAAVAERLSRLLAYPPPAPPSPHSLAPLRPAAPQRRS